MRTARRSSRAHSARADAAPTARASRSSGSAPCSSRSTGAAGQRSGSAARRRPRGPPPAAGRDTPVAGAAAGGAGARRAGLGGRRCGPSSRGSAGCSAPSATSTSSSATSPRRRPRSSAPTRVRSGAVRTRPAGNASGAPALAAMSEPRYFRLLDTLAAAGQRPAGGRGRPRWRDRAPAFKQARARR